MKLVFALFFVSPIAFANLPSDIKKLQRFGEETRRVEVTLSHYKTSQLDYKELVKSLLSNIKESSCAFSPSIGVENTVWRNLSEFAVFAQSNQAKEIIKKIARMGELKAAIGFYWNRDHGETEYCLRSSVDFYFSNGQMLSFYYDETD